MVGKILLILGITAFAADVSSDIFSTVDARTQWLNRHARKFAERDAGIPEGNAPTIIVEPRSIPATVRAAVPDRGATPCASDNSPEPYESLSL